jgi:kinesin family protein C1
MFSCSSSRSYVADLTMVSVDSEDTVTRLLHSALAARATAATRCNERSSRSHCVFQLFITGSNRSTSQFPNQYQKYLTFL